MSADHATLVLEAAWRRPRRELTFEGDLVIGGAEADLDLGDTVGLVATVRWLDGRCSLHPHGSRVAVASTILDGEHELRHGDTFTIDGALTLRIMLGDPDRGRVELRHVRTLIEPVTETLFRRFLHAYLERVPHPAALLMIDLDRFKNFNNRYGHLAGDRALRVTADRLRAEVAWPGCLVRHGGEEFAIVLPGASRDTAMAGAERIREACEPPFAVWPPEPGDDTKVEVTVSIGVAMLLDDVEATLRLAEENLIVAKTGGRNRVVG